MARLTQDFFRTILKMEGGYQAMPDDTGNYACGQLVGTKYGVSAVAYSSWVGRCPSAAEMKSITEEQAFDFYSNYFHKYNLYPIENQQFFELLANNTMGSPAGAARAEQRALNTLGYAVAVDGARGQQTVKALNDAWRRDPARIYNEVRREWLNHLYSINKPQFLPGWLKRMDTYYPPMAVAAGGLGLVLVGFGIWYAWKKWRA